MTKKALCVGINNYPGTQNDLNGCVNDAHAWADLLVAHYDFAKADVALLLDEQATKANIMAGLKDLLAGAGTGDVLVFTNSSHGTYVLDVHGDEPDHYDEALVPYDFRQNLILDDELRELFADLPAGVRLTVISDSCHSGSVTRVVAPTMVPPPRPRLLRPREFGMPDLPDDQLARLRSNHRRGHPQARMKEILLSGCKATEYSYDALIGGTYHGAMTYYAIETIREADYRITYAGLAQRLNEKLAAEGYRQTPQLEGKAKNKKRQIFV
ncbi:MAG: caspase family protein [Anaerolineae bacterium]